MRGTVRVSFTLSLYYPASPIMPKAKPQAVPFMPSDSQLLWKKDPRFKGLTISKARTAVNQYIRNLVIDLAGNPPNSSCAPPHHRDHPVSRPQISVGQKNYSKIGSYYVLVSNHSSTSNSFSVIGTYN